MSAWQDYEDTEINHESFVFYESFYIAMASLSLEEMSEYIVKIAKQDKISGITFEDIDQ